MLPSHKPPGMFASPAKIVLIILVVFAAWYAMRWLNRQPSNVMRRRTSPSPSAPGQNKTAIEDLVPCRACGTYVAAGTPRCGKAGCPQPR